MNKDTACRKCGYAISDCDLLAEDKIALGTGKLCTGYQDRKRLTELKAKRDKDQLEAFKGPPKAR